jgi:hypothetical protein
MYFRFSVVAERRARTPPNVVVAESALQAVKKR